MTTTITVTKRDGTTKSVETPYTDAQALDRLEALVTPQPVAGSANGNAHRLARSGFACDLVDKGRRFGLSEKQTAWVHILVVEADGSQEEAAVVTLPRIRQMIEQASDAGLAYPKINLAAEGGQRVRLIRAGTRSSRPGSITITDGKPYGENTFFGRIDLEGGLHPSGKMTEEVQDFLIAFDTDPASLATAYGQRMGNCCFCRRDLSTAESVAVGYGPICADRYGLPWGEERISSTVKVDGGSCTDPRCHTTNCDGNDGEADAADLEAAHDAAAWAAEANEFAD